MAAEPDRERPLTILSENPIEEIWTQLSVWESQNLAYKLIDERARKADISIPADLISRKAQALSYCIRTARENIRNPFGGLTVGNVCNYYGCMWLAAATLAARPDNGVDLATLEEFTKRGHGLGNLAGSEGGFADNEFLYVRESGFFRELLKARGVERNELSAMSLQGGRVPPFSDMSYDQRAKLLPLDALFARVPEIRSIYEYVTGRPALSFGVGHASRNMTETISDAHASGQYSSPFPTRTRDYTWLSVHGSELLSADHIRDHGPPLTDIEWSAFGGQSGWSGKFHHPAETIWHTELRLHRSAMTGTCWIKPLFGSVHDVFAIHLLLLYALSILARYRPAVWREVLEGSFDQYRSLIAGYYNVFQRVIPELALRDIAGRELHVTMPGSFNAPL